MSVRRVQNLTYGFFFWSLSVLLRQELVRSARGRVHHNNLSDDVDGQ